MVNPKAGGAQKGDKAKRRKDGQASAPGDGKLNSEIRALVKEGNAAKDNKRKETTQHASAMHVGQRAPSGEQPKKKFKKEWNKKKGGKKFQKKPAENLTAKELKKRRASFRPHYDLVESCKEIWAEKYRCSGKRLAWIG